jgi:hypothetical protein
MLDIYQAKELLENLGFEVKQIGNKLQVSETSRTETFKLSIVEIQSALNYKINRDNFSQIDDWTIEISF